MTTLPAGPELDRLIAEKVMGWDSYPALTGMASARRAILNGIPVMEAHPSCGTVEFHPSTNIAHAWEVIESPKFTDPDGYRRTYFSIDENALGWDVEVLHKGDEIEGERPIYRRVRAQADTAPLAICHAALLAVEHK